MEIRNKLLIKLISLILIPVIILACMIIGKNNIDSIFDNAWIFCGIMISIVVIVIIFCNSVINKYLTSIDKKLMVLDKELQNNKKTADNLKIELEENTSALRISEQRFKLTLDAIDEVIWEYSVKGNKLFVTEKWSELIGGPNGELEPDEVMSKVLEPRSLTTFNNQIKNCIEDKIQGFTQEIYVRTYDEQYKWLLCVGNTIKNKNNEIEKITGVLSDITVKKESEERVRKMEFLDELTGCLNKRTFMKSLDAWIGSSESIAEGALFFIDLDDFKKINDTLGHEEGDKLLKFVGKLLRKVLPHGTFIGRFGGDEFALFKPDINEIEDIESLVCDILKAFQEHVNAIDRKIHTTCSIGVARYPEHGNTSDLLLKNADTAMYRAKEIGKNTYSLYNADMSKFLDRNILVEVALRTSISNGGLYVMYQPIIDAKTEKIVSAEALIRLNDKDIGFVSPGEFIPIAEKTGLVIPTGDWVMQEAIKQVQAYHDLGYPDMGITINVSAIQLREKNFLSKLKGILDKVNVSPECIKLEVTETVLMDNIERNIELFNEIKNLGIKIALDDFGTGYSSLNYLRIIPLDVLKIDKSFIDEVTVSPTLSKIVDSIISMAHALDIIVVAEGVETKEQLEILQQKGCDLIQGYYYSKPIMPNELEIKLQSEY